MPGRREAGGGGRGEGPGGGLARSFGHAWHGLVEATSRERNMKVHVLAGLALGLAGGELALPTSSRLALVVCAMLVLAGELVNGSLESLVDLHTREVRPEARRVKDGAAAAVLVLAAGSALVAVLAAEGSWSEVAASLPRLGVHGAAGLAVLLLAAGLLVPGRRAPALDVLAAAGGTALLAALALRSLSLPFTALAAGMFAVAAASAWTSRAQGRR